MEGKGTPKDDDEQRRVCHPWRSRILKPVSTVSTTRRQQHAGDLFPLP